MTHHDDFADAGPSVAAMPVVVVSGRPFTRPQPETDRVRRALAPSGLISWPRAVRRLAGQLEVDQEEAERLLLRALRDPRGLVTCTWFRKANSLGVRVKKAGAP